MPFVAMQHVTNIPASYVDKTRQLYCIYRLTQSFMCYIKHAQRDTDIELSSP